MSAAPAILTTVVGSYPVPAWLPGAPTERALIDATRVVLHTQERAGIDTVCDGELYRFDPDHPETNGMIDYFVGPMAGVRTEISFAEAAAWRESAGAGYRRRPPGVVEGPLGSGALDLPAACARARRLTALPFKFTLTGPHMLAKVLIDRHYGDLEPLAGALAAVLAEQVAGCDADVIQIDEANLPGHPEESEIAANALNTVLDAVRGAPALHMCFGNYGGQSVQRGGWDALLGYLDSLRVDHIVMETAHRPPDELAVFADLRPGIGLGLGVVDIKRTVVETADDVARAIERAARLLGPERIRYIHPDCGFWMLDRGIADAKIAALAAGRDLYMGRRG